MHGLFIEKYPLNHKPLSQQLAEHITAHGPQGKVAVVTNKPITLLASVRKQWLRQLKFTAKAPKDLLEADITFAAADDFVSQPARLSNDLCNL